MFSNRLARLKATLQFCASRVESYTELFKLELSAYRQALVLTILAYVGLALCLLFCVAFVSIAAIVTAWETDYRIVTAWCVAGVWCALGIVAYLVARAHAPNGDAFNELGEQIRLDAAAIRASGEPVISRERSMHEPYAQADYAGAKTRAIGAHE